MGRFVAAFDSSAWELEPGETCGVRETAYGYHILRLPGVGEVRDRLSKHLITQAGMRLDSLYMDSLASSSKMDVQGDAPAIMRSAIQDPGKAIKAAKPLVRFTGGALTTRDYLRWVNALPPQYSARL